MTQWWLFLFPPSSMLVCMYADALITMSCMGCKHDVWIQIFSLCMYICAHVCICVFNVCRYMHYYDICILQIHSLSVLVQKSCWNSGIEHSSTPSSYGLFVSELQQPLCFIWHQTEWKNSTLQLWSVCTWVAASLFQLLSNRRKNAYNFWVLVFLGLIYTEKIVRLLKHGKLS
jgi:hypothetical protein